MEIFVSTLDIQSKLCDSFQNNTCKILNIQYIKSPSFFTFHLINGLWPQRMIIMWALCTEIIYHINYLNWFFCQNILFQVLWTSDGFPCRCFARNSYFWREVLLIIERNSRLLLMIQQTPPVFIYIEIRPIINSKKCIKCVKKRDFNDAQFCVSMSLWDNGCYGRYV
jgi:hypothetical protein